MIRTVSTLNLKNGFPPEKNNNHDKGEEFETFFESNDTDLSQNSLNSSENAWNAILSLGGQLVYILINHIKSAIIQ